MEDTSVKVNNVVHSFRLQSTSFDKKSYLTYLKGKDSRIVSKHHTANELKGYMKAVKKHLQDSGKSEAEVKDFETKAQGFAKKIVANFKDY